MTGVKAKGNLIFSWLHAWLAITVAQSISWKNRGPNEITCIFTFRHPCDGRVNFYARAGGNVDPGVSYFGASLSYSSVPEPTTLAILGLGAVATLAVRFMHTMGYPHRWPFFVSRARVATAKAPEPDCWSMYRSWVVDEATRLTAKLLKRTDGQ